MTALNERLVGGRFLLLAGPTPDNRAVAAVDVQQGQSCVVLFAQPTCVGSVHLLCEKEWFEALGTFPGTRAVLAWYEPTSRQPATLVLSDSPGRTLADAVRHERTVRPISGRKARAWALELINLLMCLPTLEDAVPRLSLDDLAVDGEGALSFHRIIPLPRTAATEPAHQLARLLYLLTTGYAYDPAHAWSSRPIVAVNATISPEFARWIEGTLRSEGQPSLSALHALLSAISPEATPDAWPPTPAQESGPRLWRERALAAGSALAAAIAAPPRALSLYGGLAGDLYVLAEAVGVLGVEAWREPLREAAEHLRRHPLTETAEQGSLYLGQPGIALALMRAGEVLEDRVLAADGLVLARGVASLPLKEADLLLGAAGRLKFQVWLWRQTGAAEDLAAAEETARWLQAAPFEVEGTAGLFWRSYQVAEDAPPFLGYGHGIAGIGDALLDLYLVNGDSALWATIERIRDTLRATAVPVLARRGVNWSKMLGDGILLDRWCHGAPGIGHFLISLMQVDRAPWLPTLTRAVLDTTAYGSAYLTPCLCHGLAGSIDLLLRAIRELGEEGYRVPLGQLWALLDEFQNPEPSGIGWLNHHLQSGDSALMTGYGGVLLCLLRLLEPARGRALV